MPTAYILVGVPGSGKSTWIRNNGFDADPNTVVVSTDDYIERRAALAAKTYNDVFKDEIGHATRNLERMVVWAVMQGKNIVWDQTNTSARVRKEKVSSLPPEYTKVAVVFPTPEQAELTRRLAARPGKTIPPAVMASMLKNFQLPTTDEGFDEVRVV